MSMRVDISGVAVDVETEASTAARIVRDLERGLGGLVVTVNLDHIRRCHRDARYRELVRQSRLVVADGMPLVWASAIQGTPLPERVAGSNLIWSLCDACAPRGLRVFLLGGDPGAAEGARSVLLGRFPGLNVCGVSSPPRGFEASQEQMAALRRQLLDARPDIVFVALGSPKQEYLAQTLLADLPRAWFIGCGITLSFVAGQVRRAPVWMQRLGLEWAHRLAQEPARLAKRYVVRGLPFAAVLLAGAVWRRVSGSTPRPTDTHDALDDATASEASPDARESARHSGTRPAAPIVRSLPEAENRQSLTVGSSLEAPRVGNPGGRF